MLPGLALVDDDDQEEQSTNDTTDTNNNLTIENDNKTDSPNNTTTTTTTDLQGPQEQLLSPEQLKDIRKLQTIRGLKRQNSRYVGSIGNKNDVDNADESTIKTLTPKEGKAKIDQSITKIRYIWDQFKRNKPTYEFEHRFNYKRAIWEFIYNYFHVFAYPLIIYREGMSGFWARQMLGPIPLIAWITWFISNIVYLLGSDTVKYCFWFPIGIMNLFTICRIAVIAIKYGYYPTSIFDEYSDEDTPITKDYLNSLHLVPGWVKQHPLTMAREIWKSEERLGIDLTKLRLTFRDTKAFDLYKGQNCSCSRYWTALDWFVPYIYVNTNYNASMVTSVYVFFCYLPVFIIVLYYTTFARLLPYSQSPVTYEECDVYCWLLIVSIPLTLGWSMWTGFLWSMSMALDFNRRYYRMKLCTHILDPKRETFQGNMRYSYKGHLFGSVAKLTPRKLKHLDLQTIDIYSADTIYAWSQFRNILFDAGNLFLSREEAYCGLLLLATTIMLFSFLYSLIDDDVVVVWEDLIITMLITVFVLVPTMWTLSCGNSLNYQTIKQTKILSERCVEMLHYQYNAQSNNMKHWVKEIIRGREMCEAVIDTLSQNEYSVTLLGVKIDTAVINLVATIIGLVLYLTGWFVYTKWINVENTSNSSDGVPTSFFNLTSNITNLYWGK